MKVPTEAQASCRRQLTETHHAVLREVQRKRYGSARTEGADQLLLLKDAGYLYSWQGIYYLTEEGTGFLQGDNQASPR